MRAGIGTTSLGSLAAIAAALILAPAAGAQDSGSVSDYRLPEPTQTSRPTVQGPVDPENPFGVPGRTPAPERTAAPTPAPTITLPPPSVELTPRSTGAPAPRRTEAARGATPAPAASITPEATAPTASDAAIAEPAPIESAPATEADAARNLPSSDDGADWLIPGLAAAALVGAGAILFMRRRRALTTAAEEEPAPAAAPPAPPEAALPAQTEPQRPSPAPQPVAPIPTAPVSPAPSSAPATPLPAEPLTIATAFTAKAVRLSLVYATLQYELDITNIGAEPLSPLQVRADLASAHGSIGTREQLAPSPEAMEAKHALEALAPGETTTLKGEVRVPLQQIVPVKKGNAHFLVPLVRFCILAPDGAAVRRVFTAGPHDPGSNAIASVRLDAGPRNLRELNAREIEAARSFTLDPIGAQG